MRTPLSTEVRQVYDNWYGGADHKLLFFWERDGTVYIVTSFPNKAIEGVRILSVGGEYHISVDHPKVTP